MDSRCLNTIYCLVLLFSMDLKRLLCNIPSSLLCLGLCLCSVVLRESFCSCAISLVQFSRSVVSDSLRPHELQHARPPYPSPSPGVHSESRPSSQWCHPAISSSVVHFSSCPQSLPTSESFPMSQLSPWGGQSTGVSALASFLQRKPRADGWFMSMYGKNHYNIVK